MEYQATALGKEFENNRKAGKLIVSSFTIQFEYEGGKISWNTGDVKFSIGGVGNKFVFLNNASKPNITLYTPDKKILKDPELRNSVMADSASLQSLNRKHNWRYVVLAIAILLVLSPIALFFGYRSAIVKKVADQVSPSVERKIGEQLFSTMVLGKDILKDSTLNAQLLQVLQPLINTTQTDGFTFNFYIINDTTVNAFALPGGNVVIHSGLIDKADNWSEVQAVLAHEIAHVRQRHHLRGIINNYGVSFLASALLGDMSTLLNVATTIGGNLESLMYSRKFEFEADNNGWNYLVQSHINPQGMISFFDKLQALSGQAKLEKTMSILSTHPATADRITNLKKKTIETPAAGFIQPSVDIAAFKINMNQIFKNKTK